MKFATRRIGFWQKIRCFNHFIYGSPEDNSENAKNECMDWNRCVDSFDVDALAYNLRLANASY